MQDGAAVVDGASADAMSSTTVTIGAAANIWGAGHATAPEPEGGGGGSLPSAIALPGGQTRSLALAAVTGQVSYDGSSWGSADGFSGPAHLASTFDGLSYPVVTQHRFLGAVFLDDNEPADPAPASLEQDPAATEFEGIVLGQIVFVGDGLTGLATGSPQAFVIPSSATRVFLGFSDSCSDNAVVLPGCFDDNAGSVDLAVVVSGAR